MLKGYKYRIYPNKEQEKLINKTFGCCRFVYNQILAKKIELYKNEGETMGKYECQSYCNNILKNKYPWLRDVDKFSLQNSIVNLDKAYQNFFREIKKGNNKQGFPKFKSKKNNRLSYRTTANNTNNIDINFKENKIKLPKLRWVKCKIHRQFNGRIVNATISKTPSGKYFVGLCVETENSHLCKNNNTIGLDLGLKDLVICSDGQVFENNKTLYKYEKQLAKLQRQFTKKTKGSNNWNKHRIKMAKVYEKITNIRKDYLHKISSQLIRENQFIFSEDLNIRGMVKNHKLAKSIHDASWYELIRQLEYKSEWYGRTYIKVSRYYPSSQLCNVCGYKNEDTKNLGVRFWVCPECNTEHDRDINASINILNEGLKVNKYVNIN